MLALQRRHGMATRNVAMSQVQAEARVLRRGAADLLRGTASATAGVIGRVVAVLAVLALGGSGTGGSPEIAGCPVFPISSPWNQPVDKLPVTKDSAAITRSIGLDSP